MTDFFLFLADTAANLVNGAAADPAAAAAAEEAIAPAGEPWWQRGLVGFYLGGEGWTWLFMIPLFICQVIVLGVIIERIGALRSINIDTTAFRLRIRQLLAGNRIDEAIVECDNTPGPIAATLAVGLRKFKLLVALKKPADQIEAEVSKSVDDYGPHLVSILEKHLPMLATIAVLGPLFGFLGTVGGMVHAFGEIEAAAGSGSIIQVAAAGIKTALYTTILGLLIGIVAQWSYNAFTSRINTMVLDVEESASELIQNLALMTAMGAEALAEPAQLSAPSTQRRGDPAEVAETETKEMPSPASALPSASPR